MVRGPALFESDRQGGMKTHIALITQAPTLEGNTRGQICLGKAAEWAAAALVPAAQAQ